MAELQTGKNPDSGSPQQKKRIGGRTVWPSLISLFLTALASISGGNLAGWTVAAVLLCFAAGVYGALLLDFSPKKLLFLLLPLLPLSVAVLLSRNGWFPVFMLGFFLAASSMAWYTGHRAGRTKQILFGSVPIAAVLIGELLVFLLLRYPGRFQTAPALLFDDLENWMVSYLTAGGQQLEQMAGSMNLSQLSGWMKLLSDAEAIREIAHVNRQVLQMSLPGLLLMASNLLAALLSQVLLVTARILRVCPESFRGKQNSRITVSTGGGCIFLVGTLFYVLGQSGSDPAYDLQALGLALILCYLPALVPVGARSLFLPQEILLAGSKEVVLVRRPSFLKLALLLLTFLFVPVLLPYLLALFGASAVLTAAMNRKTGNGSLPK